MNPSSTFAFLIATAQSLVAAVTTRDNLHLRPSLARQAVAARLRSGMILLRAFLRRLIILMALEMEWHLVDTRGEMKRPHGRRRSKSTGGFTLQGLDAQGVSPWLNAAGPKFKTIDKQVRNPRVEIDMAKLYAQLDYLAKLAANPTAKAKRMAFHLARTHEGIIMAPTGPKRIAGRWVTQVRASYDGIAESIMTKSRNRPPPLPPPRNYWPTITAL
jgi:hypothetical protein